MAKKKAMEARKWEVLLLVLVASCGLALGDIYMHNPRGSNNRLNEQTDTRQTNNRLFDSQNNARGGYNVGDKASTAAGTNGVTATSPSPDNLYDPTDLNPQQYPMVFFEGSNLPVEWTNQHGCGGNVDDPRGGNCNLVLQFTCDTDNSKVTDPALQVTLRDGTTTTQVNEGNANTASVGLHESAQYYAECRTRTRNKGLFTADQNLNNNNQATATRQNPNAGQSGLECSEERDYYPYWLPTPWRDVAYLTDRPDLCTWIKSQSQNRNPKYKCYLAGTPSATVLDSKNLSSCLSNGGQWLSYTHGMPNDVDCQQVDWTRENHLGNGRANQPLNYNWTIPLLSTMDNLQLYGSANNYARCVLRLRYNISTDDYDPWNTTVANNKVIANNPIVDIGADLQGIQIELNTNQAGRTFQDRSHVFYVKKRPSSLSGSINNLNVRGKRGNIVQTYPAVEYDFVPTTLTVSANSYIHVQWTGSNTHNNAGGAGDGQAGDDGQGTDGTDRSNMAALRRLNDTYPLPLDKSDVTGQTRPFNLMQAVECYDFDGNRLGSAESTTGVQLDCAVRLASSGYFLTASSVTGATGSGDGLDPLLNNAPASLVGGVVFKAVKKGTFHYVSTRNNNFSNRVQKGTIVIQ